MFECNKCGQCCRHVGNVFIGKHLADADGVCRYLDKSTNLCTIYLDRPIFCNIDKYYETFLYKDISREEFYEENRKFCLSLMEKEGDSCIIKKQLKK